MFYFCGSDLESKYSYTTVNLKDISQVAYPYNLQSIYTSADPAREDMKRDIGKVNILIETGGSAAWHTDSLGMNTIPGNGYRQMKPTKWKCRRSTGILSVIILPEKSFGSR